MENLKLDLYEKALLIHALECFILANTPYTKSSYATGREDTNLLVAKRLLNKVEIDKD